MPTYDKIVWYQGRKLPAMEINELQEDTIVRAKDLMTFLYGKTKLVQNVNTTTATNAVTITSAGVWINGKFYTLSNVTVSNLFGSSSNASGILYVKMAETLVTASQDATLYAPTLQGVPTADRIQYTFTVLFTTGTVPADVTGQSPGNNIYYLGIASLTGNNGVAPTVSTSGYVTSGVGSANSLNGVSADTNATANTIAQRDGAGDLYARIFWSNVATGNSPFKVTSTTVVPNLNVDMVDGWHLDQDVRTTASPTFANITASNSAVFNGTVTLNTPAVPFIFKETDQTGATGVWRLATDGGVWRIDRNTATSRDLSTFDSPLQISADGSLHGKVATLDDGSGNSIFRTVTSNVATGTAPLSVTSTTVVPNLNSDMVDGHHLDQDVTTTSSPTFNQINATSGVNANKNLVANKTTGTNPGVLVYASNQYQYGLNMWSDGTSYYTGLVTAPSAGFRFLAVNSAGAPASQTDYTSVASVDASGNSSFRTVASNVATGTAPLSVTSTTMVTNLNAQYVNGYTTDQNLRKSDSPNWLNGTVLKMGTGSGGTYNGSVQVTSGDQYASVQMLSGSTLKAQYIGDMGSGTVYFDSAGDFIFRNTPNGGTAVFQVKNSGAIYAGNAVLNDGSGNSIFRTVTSNVAQGTAPFTVTSTTQVNNLNVDKVDGYDFNQSLQTVDTPTFGSLTLSQVTGTAPLTVASTTVVTNLNADKVDGYDFDQDVRTTASPTFVKAIFSQATGTAPFTVTSTTKVANLNADQVDGYDTSMASTASSVAVRDTSKALTASYFVSDVAQGTAPLFVTSTTKVTNLNVDQVDGYDFNQSLKTTDSPTFAGATFSGAISSTGQSTFKTATNISATLGLTTQAPDASTVSFAPSLGAGSFNNLVQSGDQGIIFNSKNSSANASFLSISPWSTTKAGIRIGSDASVKTANNTLDDGAGNATFLGAVNARDGGVIGNSTNGYVRFANDANYVHVQGVNGAQTGAKALMLSGYGGISNTIRTYNNVLDDGSGNLNVHGYGFVNGYINPTAMGATAQGIGFGWNYSGGTGEADIFCYGQGGTGGLKVYNTNQVANNVFTKIFDVDGSGNVTIPGTLTVNGQAVGNNVGDLSQYTNRISYESSSINITSGQTIDLVNVTGKGYLSLATLYVSSNYSIQIIITIDGSVVYQAYVTGNKATGITVYEGVQMNSSNAPLILCGGTFQLVPGLSGTLASNQNYPAVITHPIFFNSSCKVSINQGSGVALTAGATVKGAYK